MPELASKLQCAGCGACKEKCSKGCIEYRVDECDNRYPLIKRDECIQCGQCVKACPAINKNNLLKFPKAAYAAWSNDVEVRKNSASGGIASELYEFLRMRGWICYGVYMDENYEAKYRKIESKKDIICCRNSKYVFSDIGCVLGEIEQNLRKKEKVFVVGLPCQIAGLKKYLGKEYDNLLIADMLCHGVCSPEYLKQHIAYIEQKEKRKCHRIFFRNPRFDTENFHFTLEDGNDYLFYNKAVGENDTYQIGYHKAILYRENCYQCAYATSERVGDITLGDYWMIGQKIPFEYPKKHVSLVLAQTEKGKNIIQNVEYAKQIVVVERPIEEAIEIQEQLKKPCKRTIEHNRFIKKYSKDRDFEAAAYSVMKGWIFSNKYGLGRYYEKYQRIRYKLFGC